MNDWVTIFKLVGISLFFILPMLLGWWHNTLTPYIVVHLRGVGHMKCINLADTGKIEIDGIQIRIQHRTLKPLMHMGVGELKLTLADGSVYEDAYAKLWFFRGAEAAQGFFHELIQGERKLPAS